MAKKHYHRKKNIRKPRKIYIREKKVVVKKEDDYRKKDILYKLLMRI